MAIVDQPGPGVLVTRNMNSGAVGAAQTWASGYMNAFQQWSYARNAFDRWAVQLAQRLAAVRGFAPKAMP